jgi:peptidoglycan/LPS O-acetylase OafA/YrhL
MTASRERSIPARIAAMLRDGVDDIIGRRARDRVPALDFLRAVAVVLVLCGHWSSAVARVGGDSAGLDRLPFFRVGWAGVDLFFVLSGYLIGRQLWGEAATSGTVVFPRFFARRALRIWPLYFFVCLVVAIFPIPGEGPVRLSDLFFFSNYRDHGIAGGWSLSTEEQFYVLGPLLIIVFARLIPLRGFFAVLGAAAAATALCRYMTYSPTAANSVALPALYYAFHLHNDGLLAGLALALLFTLRRDWLSRDDLSLRGWLGGLALAAVGIALYSIHQRAFNFLALALIFGGITLALLLDRTFITRLLHRRAFRVLSVLSYGMYLNQFVWLEILPSPWTRATSFWPPAFSFLVGAGLLCALSALLSSVTYVLIEHPFLVLRERWLSRPTTRHTHQPAASAA